MSQRRVSLNKCKSEMALPSLENKVEIPMQPERPGVTRTKGRKFKIIKFATHTLRRQLDFWRSIAADKYVLKAMLGYDIEWIICMILL